MDQSVSPRPPEGEPDNVTPPGWTTTPGGFQVPADLDDDPRLWTGEPQAAESPTHTPSGQTRYADLGPCKCGAEAGKPCQRYLTVGPDAGKHVDREIPHHGRPAIVPVEQAPDFRHFANLGDAYTICGLERATVRWTDDPETSVDCPRCTQLGATTEPERRTVSLEVLTDELRAEFGKVATEPIWGGSVAVVARVNGEVVDIPEIDTLWQAPYRNGADVLSVMLRQARHYASGIDGHAGVELLMPTPDVLAALSGTPDAQLLTAPVQVLAMDITAGMLLHSTDDDGDGAETLELVTAVRDCGDSDCVNGNTCIVLTVSGHEDPDVHFNGYSRTSVRIPAAQAATR